MKKRYVLDVQRFYPQIYLGCHVDHVRASSTAWQLSSHDSSTLAHLDYDTPMSPHALAKHLGVRPSTLSATIARLVQLGYLRSEPATRDKRHRELRLTEKGAQAMASTSVLDAAQVSRMLTHLTPDEQAEAIHGLALLARAARALQEVQT